MDVDNETMIDTKFLKRFTNGIDTPFCPEILEVDEKLTNIPWLTVPVPRIEPDDWDLFWQLWQSFKNKSAKYDQIWDTVCIWSNPNLTDEQLKTEYPIISKERLYDWSKHFPNMFKQINEAMPFLSIDKITILDIKLDKIKDNRKNDVQKEYDLLFDIYCYCFYFIIFIPQD
jgi:hypothetical protein